nr:hypothetical protein [Tanacetum cinerariifolium]
MSDSDESGVTYTEVSSPFEDLSDIGSPRANDYEHLELPGMLEDPYVEVALQAPPYPDYIPGPEEPEQASPLPDYVPGPEHADDEIVTEDQPYAEDASPTAQSPEYVLESDLEAHPKEDDDEDPEEDPADEEEEEEHPAPSNSVVVSLPAADHAPSAEETEPFETDESAATPPPHPAYRMTARISILVPVPIPAWSDSEVIRLLAMSSPPSSPLSPLSSPPPQIPFPPLPSILSPPSPVLSPAPPPSYIHSLGYRAAMIRLQAEAASTSHSPPLLLPFILSPTRSDAPSSGIPPPLPISAPTSSPPLQLPSTSRRKDRPEVTLPPRKRLGISLGPRYEVGESSSAAAARPAGGLRADYGFVATIDMEIRRDSERERLDMRSPTHGTRQWRPYREHQERHAHAYTRHLMETEARLSREAWVQSVDASDLARDEVMSLRTTVLGQMTKIRELHTADYRRQIVTSEMLRADHRRSAEIRGLRTADRTRQQQLIQTLTMMQTLQGQMTTLQEQVTALQGQGIALQHRELHIKRFHLGIPTISGWVYTKTSALEIKRSCSLSLKCSGNCFSIVTGYFSLMNTFSSSSMQLKTPFLLAGGVSLTFFIPSFILLDSYVENIVLIPLVVWNMIAPWMVETTIPIFCIVVLPSDILKRDLPAFRDKVFGCVVP